MLDDIMKMIAPKAEDDKSDFEWVGIQVSVWKDLWQEALKACGKDKDKATNYMLDLLNSHDTTGM